MLIEALEIPCAPSGTFVYLKLGQVDRSIEYCNAALRVEPRKAHSLYGRGIAKRRKADIAGSEADIAAANTISPRIAEQYRGYSIPP